MTKCALGRFKARCKMVLLRTHCITKKNNQINPDF